MRDVSLKRSTPYSSCEGRTTPDSHIATGGRTKTLRFLEIALLAIAAALYALHFVHLRADFPNYSPWPDWAKYTDEGWYGSAAIRHRQLGYWNLPGDFNPAAALPVWPLLELILFHITGVSLVAARALTVAIFGLILVATHLLLRRWASDRAEHSAASGPLATRPLAPAIAVLLLAASPFYFAFSRLAILEPLMLLLALTGLLLAQRAGVAHRQPPDNSAATWSALLGFVLTAIVLTKTTGIFLLPAIAWTLWANGAYRLGVFLRAAAIAFAAAAASWGGYMLFFVRPRYLADYRYLFSANAYTGITPATFWSVVVDTFSAGNCLGITFFSLGVAAVLITTAAVTTRRFRGDGLAVSLLLWVFFYLAFLAYHDNLQPRYYYVLGVPLAMLIAMASDWLLQPATTLSKSAVVQSPTRRYAHFALLLAACVSAGAIAFISIHGATQATEYVAHPEYTFLTAVHQLRDTIERQRAQDLANGQPAHPEMLLSISGADISFLTGLPSICDDFGTMTLPTRIATYKPGWYAAWNDVEDDKMEALAPVYRLVRVGAWSAFDDPDRNLLILYRLDPLDQPGIGNGRRRKALNMPRRLRRKATMPPPAKH